MRLITLAAAACALLVVACGETAASVESTSTATSIVAIPDRVSDTSCAPLPAGQPTPAEGAVISKVSVSGHACAPAGGSVELSMWALHWLGERDIVARVSFDLPDGLSVVHDDAVSEPSASGRTMSYVEIPLPGDSQGTGQDTFKVAVTGKEPGEYELPVHFQWHEKSGTDLHDFATPDRVVNIAFFTPEQP